MATWMQKMLSPLYQEVASVRGRRPWRVWHVILACSVVTAVLNIGVSFYLPARVVWPDETGYHTIARNLVAGNGYSNATAELVVAGWPAEKRNAKDASAFAPGPVLFLAAVFKATGSFDIAPARVAQGMVMAFLPLLAFLLAESLFGNLAIGLFAAAAIAVYPYYVFLANCFLPQTLLSPLVLAWLLLTIRAYRYGGVAAWAAAGFVHGGLVLFVVTVQLMVVPVLVAIVWRSRGTVLRRLGYAVFFLCASGMVTGSYAAVISAKEGRFVPITSQTDNVLVKFNLPGITAKEVLTRNLSTDSQQERRQLMERFERSGNPKSAAIGWAVSHFASHPITFARNCGLRLLSMFSPRAYTESANRFTGTAMQFVGIVAYVPVLVLFAVACGVVVRERRWPAILVLSCFAFYLAPYMVTIGTTRFRLPWDGVMIVFAAAMLTRAARYLPWFRSKSTKIERQSPLGQRPQNGQSVGISTRKRSLFVDAAPGILPWANCQPTRRTTVYCGRSHFHRNGDGGLYG
jgi:hypothetical protein